MTQPAAQIDVVGIGMISVDELFLLESLPVFGAHRRAQAHGRQCGGPAATAMATLARLGVATRMIGRVGDDADGKFLCQQLRRQGVDVSRVQQVAGRTRVAGVFVEAGSGERGFLSIPESHLPLSAQDIDADDLAAARFVHLDDADATGLRAAQLAGDVGQRVIFDGTWQSQYLQEFLPLVEVAIVSQFFARNWLPDAPDTEILMQLLDLGADTAVLTLGADGAIAATATDRIVCACPAFAVDVVDTTGAGDAFHGGFIYGLLQAWDLPTCLHFATATGALNCRHLGGQAGLPDLATVQALLT